jgi:hypothetical protein
MSLFGYGAVAKFKGIRYLDVKVLAVNNKPMFELSPATRYITHGYKQVLVMRFN